MYPFGSCFYSDICPGVGFQGQRVAVFLVFKRTSILHSIVAVPICIPIKVKESSLLSTPFPECIVSGFFYDSHSGWCEMISCCSFNLIFLIIRDVKHLLMRLCPSVRLPWRNAYLDFLPIS